ncbi:MAG: hypothetical protein A3F72_05425 [Bacteroidetes bacterium RIFCSPLOWO2_12_FULL_35_15]|nr:MAG: hypothetical protein A3F72_05425 [Bacteroidetes bacterium RIFCSPLOWO2_12_FULL_35_15]
MMFDISCYLKILTSHQKKSQRKLRFFFDNFSREACPQGFAFRETSKGAPLPTKKRKLNNFAELSLFISSPTISAPFST